MAARAANALKSTLTLVGGVVTAKFLLDCYEDATFLKKDNEKRVLLLPFHRISFVEGHSSRFSSLVQDENQASSSDEIKLQLRELVNLIHEAAADPNIVALHGTFGNGSALSAVGWANLEEVRSALRVFRESHRIHPEPKLEHIESRAAPQNRNPKPLYAYAESFDFSSSGSKSYYLSSAFTDIYLQRQGRVQLFGMHSRTFFINDLLKMFGIKVNVAKQGYYKNAPNFFTENGFTCEHKLNVAGVQKSLHQKIHNDIAADRGLSMDWRMVHDKGTLTAEEAKTGGFVDDLADRDPLENLVEFEKRSDKTKVESIKHIFPANKTISLEEYAKIVAKRQRIESRKWKTYKRLKYCAENSTAATFLLWAIGCAAPYYNMKNNPLFSNQKAASLDERIAVVTINGAIENQVAKKVIDSLKEIKQDRKVRCVILRVNSPGGTIDASERIYQECKLLPQPLISSFDDVAASGGYYVSVGAARIFALPTTVTGSIGVFGIKFDLSSLAKKYGVTTEFVSTGKYAAASDEFHPLNNDMRADFQFQIDRCYANFKSMVSKGRSIPLEQVDQVALGRVFTGEQAKDNGLVDELGGLNRAISYARRTYTSGAADVEFWPKEDASFFKVLRVLLGKVFRLPFETPRSQFSMGSLKAATLSDLTQPYNDCFRASFFDNAAFRQHSGIYLVCDEALAVKWLLSDLLDLKK